MEPKELKKLVKSLREMGITHYKNGDVDITLTPEPPVKYKKLTDEEEAKIKHNLEEMTSIMKLDDQELLERMFPDYTQKDEAS